MSLPVRLLLAFALIHLVFATWPGIDLAVSGLFFEDGGFPLRGSAVLEAVRQGLWWLTILAALASLLAWPVWAALGHRARVAARVWAFAAGVFVLGPGLLVNGLLKSHWGRARPADVAWFGGEAAFTPPFQIAGECARNCSFVSGEAAGAAALAVVGGALVPDARVRAGLWTLAAVAGGLRVATGRHFASDVVFSWLLMGVVALGLWRLMGMDAARRTLTARALAHDLALMRARLARGARRLYVGRHAR